MQKTLRYFVTICSLLLITSLAQAEETRGHIPEKMTVTVVDEAGKPITHASGGHRFLGGDFNVNENGVMEIPIASRAGAPALEFTFRAEGYRPFKVSFKEASIVPDTFTVVLKPAQRIGGIVVDEEGNPIEGVSVVLIFIPETAYRLETVSEFDRTTHALTRTDSKGMWTLFQLPATFSHARFFLRKEGFEEKFVVLPSTQLNPDAAGQFNKRITLKVDPQIAIREQIRNTNPIFQSSLPFLKDPVPRVDSKATAETEMKPYTETIPGTEQTFKMIPIKGGKFTMGSPDTEPGRHDDEGPQHEVEVLPFWMEEHETTWTAFEQYAMKHLRIKRKEMVNLSERDRTADAFAAPTSIWGACSSHMNKGKPGFPAAGMTIYAAQAYCKWLTMMTGRYYRLPTEAEWEYACRAGSTTAYSFGDDVRQLGNYAWGLENSKGEVQKIKMKKPNAWGLYDMHGNVAEYVLERYAQDTYAQRKSEAFAAPVKPALTRVGIQGGINVLRGGSIDHESADLRSSRRLHYTEEWRADDPGYPRSIWWLTSAPHVGFRVVRPLHPPKTEEEAKLYEPDPEIWLSYYERNARD